jgi:hypothetical protein
VNAYLCLQLFSYIVTNKPSRPSVLVQSFNISAHVQVGIWYALPKYGLLRPGLFYRWAGLVFPYSTVLPKFGLLRPGLFYRWSGIVFPYSTCFQNLASCDQAYFIDGLVSCSLTQQYFSILAVRAYAPVLRELLVW